MIIKRIPAGVYAANCYVIMDEYTKEAVILDPGGDEDDIMSLIEQIGAKVKYILLTHGHVDHTGGVIKLKEKYDCKVGINQRDEELMINGAYMFGEFENHEQVDFLLKDGDTICFGDKKIIVLETPGHTPGGVSFLVEDKVFTGDTLFAGSIGRTDLTGGDFQTIIDSIKAKLMLLKEETIVYPGHGPKSSIGIEKKSNPFL
ncbi:MBL fold metallo-hydrolase [Clostridium algidicarnis]|uniref:MBL fold metallo-hydrolase n=1 Tax=Clostridium algidicarnis TaxID=37659 RepID=UPI001C0C4DE4|nr:MBL fold metallo-hydrolase [Clostridium algidicarnis]MBU3195738.1 MBL fold metallo-hydrolase [Clostridium algidicarnis]MBU3208760.1 MBL fold metallo-hydrolase [Clostridium algidicarnis]